MELSHQTKTPINVHVICEQALSLSHDRVKVAGIPRDRIVRMITLEGDLSVEQRVRLLEIANKCPVHKALEQPLVIESTLVD